MQVTVQQVCALAALTVRQHGIDRQKSMDGVNSGRTFARNCEGAEQLRMQ